MTIDEAIKHCKEVADRYDKEAKFHKYRLSQHPNNTSYERRLIKCLECSSERRQIAEWLKELKMWREGKIVQLATDNTEILIFNKENYEE